MKVFNITVSRSQKRTGVAKVLQQKKEYLVPSVYHFYQDPPLIVRGEGCYLIDADGQQYLDCYSGVGAMSLGHSHPDILAAVHKQVDMLQHTTTIYLTETMFELAELLAELAPVNLCKTFFCASGTEANESAMLMAAVATGRENFLSLNGGLHGRTKSAMSVTQIPMWRTDPYLLESCHIAPGYRDENSLETILQILQTEEYAAVIIEPIQGNGGIIPPPEGFMQALKTECQQTGTLLIADEIQTGINRTGTFYAIEQEGVVPDFLTTAKALGNGFPIAACITNNEIAKVNKRPAASTYGANPIACQAALAALECHQTLQLEKQSEQLGGYLTKKLQQIAEKYSCIHEIRGRGLMIGVELQSGRELAAAELTDSILEEMKNNGFLLGKTGLERNVLTFMPPLIITESQLDEVCQALEERLATMSV
ncbi:Acetylornithine aminotransferase [hydrothermal vent metagenome]|uniref:alanine--glyoxylate transaminase n=1 Tax=hydrothermal vent metagenome TaxID=652676 RepID=A0A3B1E721_9ZZZZ